MGGPNHNNILQHVPSEKPTQNPTTLPIPSRVMVWCCGIMTASHGWRLLNTFYSFRVMVWCCGIMTASHGWRLLNTFYRYQVNLIRVWSGWEVPIISYSMSPLRNPLKILRPSPLLLEDGMVWCCDIMTSSHGWRLLNTFYRYEGDLVRVWVDRSLSFVMVVWFVPR